MQPAVQIIPARTPIRHALEQWSGFCQRYAVKTRITYKRIIKTFIAYVQPETIMDIRPNEIQAYVNSRLSKNSHTGLNLHIATIKSFCRWLSDNYGIPNPSTRIRNYPSDTQEARCLSSDEYHKILSATTGRDFHLIRFLANTGLRASELTDLTPNNIQDKWLTVRGKGGKIRHIPLNGNAAESLKVVMNFSRNAQITYHRCIWIAEEVGIPPFGPHACRHYFATQLLSKGKPIHAVSKILGHSSVLITEKIYYHFRPEHLSGLTDCLE